MSHVDVLRVEQPCPAGISLMDGAGYGTCTTTLDVEYCLYCCGWRFAEGDTAAAFLARYNAQYPSG